MVGGGGAVMKVLAVWQILVLCSDESFVCISEGKSKYLTQ